MKHNNFSFLVGEGTKAIFKHGFMSFAAVCITVACLVIVTSFGLITYNIGLIVDDLQKENEVLICIDESYTEAEAKSVGSRINLISNVHEAKFVSREQALDNFVGKQSDTTAFNGVDASILRDRYEVTVEDNSLLEQTVAEIEKIDGVAEVNAYYEIANGFQSLQKVLNIASMVIIIVLFVVSLFIISNTVKLAMYSRSEEIAIMKMVGATNSFIRLPFVVEGFILGMLGAVIAFFLEWGLYDFLQAKIAVVDTLRLFQIVPFAEVIELVAISYALTGFAVGVVGSLLSIRKFLKV